MTATINPTAAASRMPVAMNGAALGMVTVVIRRRVPRLHDPRRVPDHGIDRPYAVDRLDDERPRSPP